MRRDSRPVINTLIGKARRPLPGNTEVRPGNTRCIAAPRAARNVLQRRIVSAGGRHSDLGCDLGRAPGSRFSAGRTFRRPGCTTGGKTRRRGLAWYLRAPAQTTRQNNQKRCTSGTKKTLSPLFHLLKMVTSSTSRNVSFSARPRQTSCGRVNPAQTAQGQLGFPLRRCGAHPAPGHASGHPARRWAHR